MGKREDFIAEVRSWIDTPYGHQGRQKGLWADCVCVPLVSAVNVGLLPDGFDFLHYGTLPNPAVMEKMLDMWCKRIPKGEERPGDIGWMKDPVYGGAPRHLFVIVAPGVIVHSHSGAAKRNKMFAEGGRCVEMRLTRQYTSKVVRYYRYPGLED